jgi:hypothetical protein
VPPKPQREDYSTEEEYRTAEACYERKRGAAQKTETDLVMIWFGLFAIPGATAYRYLTTGGHLPRESEDSNQAIAVLFFALGILVVLGGVVSFVRDYPGLISGP